MVVFVVAPARVLATLLAAPLKYINGEISLVRRPVIHHAYAFTVIYAGAPAPPSEGGKNGFRESDKCILNLRPRLRARSNNEGGEVKMPRNSCVGG